MLTEALFLILAVIFSVAWGAAENRVWKESGENWILNHFKLYHLLMALLFGWVNALTVTVMYHAFSVSGVALWFWLMLCDTLLLDVVWWSIRYFDITYLGKEWLLFGFTVWTFPTENEYDGGLGKPWHSRSDWDNFLKLPLIGGTYLWWIIFVGVLILLGVTICVI